jgi:O-antigen ligase
MPHPNILAGLLVILSLLNLYLLNKELNISSRGIYLFAYCVNILGIFLCFSRGGIIAYAVSTAIFLIFTIVEQGIHATFRKFYLLPILLIVLVFIFYPWYQSKNTFSDQSSLLRSEYNHAGIRIIKSNWLIGTGPGTNLLHMKHELQNKLDYWDIQPIHNYFLIVISEFGVIGISWILFLIYLSMRLTKQTYTNLKQNISNTWHITLLSQIDW